MLNEQQILELIQGGESDRLELTISVDNSDKFCKAICAFANDMPDHKLPGYLLIGIKDDGSIAGLKFTDEQLRTLSQLRDNGRIQPLPSMKVYRIQIGEFEILVVEVTPADMPPVRYKGQVYIRIGSQKVIASEQQERQLSERRINHIKNFDAQPCKDSSLTDLVQELFLINYLPRAVDPQIIQDNHRDLSLKLASLRFYDLKYSCPTYAGILLFANDPLYWLSFAYIQFLQLDGNSLEDSSVINDKKISGDLLTVLRELDLLVATLISEYPRQITSLQEKTIINYPTIALRELLMNAVMHRDYQSHSPIRFYWFKDHVEIQNPGGLYGDAKKENFPRVNAYRNPVIAEAMNNLGYVNKYGQGVFKAQKSLRDNGNKEAEFTFGNTHTLVILYSLETSTPGN